MDNIHHFQKENTMNGKTRAFEGIVLVAGVALVLFAITGCTKKQEPASQEGAVQTQVEELSPAVQEKAPQDETAQTKAEELSTAVQETAAAAKEQVAEAIEQKTCPIMDGNPINKNLFVEYKGKKVYFCCAACKEKFAANPEQYIAALPQFQQ